MQRRDFFWIAGSVLLTLLAIAPQSVNASSHNLPDITATPLSFDGEVMRYRVFNLGESRVRRFVQVEYRWVDRHNNPVSEACREGNNLLPGLPTSVESTWDDPGGSEVIRVEPSHIREGCPFWHVPTSAHRLRVKLDATNATPEANESNNTFYFDRPLADLVLEPIDMDLDAGRLRFRARNRGTGIVSDATPIEIRWVDANNVPKTEPCKNSFNDLPILPTGPDDTWQEVGGSEVITIEDWHYRNGCPFFETRLGSWRKVRIVVDPNNQIPESNNTNNTIYVQRPLPDLSISSASFVSRTQLRFTIQQAAILKRGDVNVKFEWIHRNGTTRLGDTLTMEVEDIGEGGARTTRVDSNDYSSLKSFIARPPEYARFLNIVLDPGDDVSETNDTNNTRQLARPLPDLVIENARWNQSNVSFTVRNTTNVPGGTPSAMSKIRFEWRNASGGLVNVFHDISLPVQVLRANGAMGFGPYVADSTVNRWFTNRPADATALWITVDPIDTVLEQNKNNNRAILAR